MYILHYLISQITSEETLDKLFVWKEFPSYARALEEREHIPVGRFFEPVTKSREQIEDILIFHGFFHRYNSDVLEVGLFRKDTTSWSQEVYLMGFYLFSNLSLSLKGYIANHRDCIDRFSWTELFKWASEHMFKGIWTTHPGILQVLIDANVDAEISPVDFTALKSSVNEEYMNVDMSWLQTLQAQQQQARKRRGLYSDCLLYTSPSPRDATLSRMPSSA